MSGRDLVNTIAYATARALRRGARFLEGLSDSQRIAIQRSASSHDMAGDADEQYYARQYLQWIEPEIGRLGSNRDLGVLDIGCGQGRLLFPLARIVPRGRLVGIDLTSSAIDAVRLRAREEHLTNIEVQVAEVRSFLQQQPAQSFDVVLMTEVSYMVPGLEHVLRAIAFILRPQGLFIGSFRSQHYNLVHAIGRRNWPAARLALGAREGHWSDTAVEFNWQTPADVVRLLTDVGLRVKSLQGIGVFSGIDGDPLSVIARPSTLPENERQQLLDLEIAASDSYAGCGRYILAIATNEGESAMKGANP